jgi:hypothetical protein
MADKKRDILEFVEQSNFEQFTPTRPVHYDNLLSKKLSNESLFSRYNVPLNESPL